VNALCGNALGAEDVGTVVATLGTTATGSLDPLPEILKLRKKVCNFACMWMAAYGGYFCVGVEFGGERPRKFLRELGKQIPIVIDPHTTRIAAIWDAGCVLFPRSGSRKVV